MAPELILNQRVTNLIDVYSFGCIVNEIYTEKTCYWDYKVRTQALFFKEVKEGLRPTILPNTPLEIKCLLIDCYKNKSSRPNMKSIVKRIRSWDPSTW